MLQHILGFRKFSSLCFIVMSTIIPESPSSQLQLVLRWLDHFAQGTYEKTRTILTDDFVQYIVPSSVGLFPMDKDEAVSNGAEFRSLCDEMRVCPTQFRCLLTGVTYMI
jgi:hypothetical protein